MNLSLFVAQLNQLLQSKEIAEHPEEVCELLRTHISAAVLLVGHDGQPYVELLEHEPIGIEQHQLSIPIIAGSTTIGNLSICRTHAPFTDDENLAFSIAVSICTIILRNREAHLAVDTRRRRDAVRNLINNLSFSELEATVQIVKDLGDKTEGLLVAGHIADRLGFTRSVVTVALKKLEGASLIETRSLGVKGTHIRIKNALLQEELAKL